VSSRWVEQLAAQMVVFWVCGWLLLEFLWDSLVPFPLAFCWRPINICTGFFVGGWGSLRIDETLLVCVLRCLCLLSHWWNLASNRQYHQATTYTKSRWLKYRVTCSWLAGARLPPNTMQRSEQSCLRPDRCMCLTFGQSKYEVPSAVSGHLKTKK